LRAGAEGKTRRGFFNALASDPELRELAKENSYHFATLVGLACTHLSAESP